MLLFLNELAGQQGPCGKKYRLPSTALAMQANALHLSPRKRDASVVSLLENRSAAFASSAG